MASGFFPNESVAEQIETYHWHRPTGLIFLRRFLRQQYVPKLRMLPKAFLPPARRSLLRTPACMRPRWGFSPQIVQPFRNPRWRATSLYVGPLRHRAVQENESTP